MPAVEHFSHIVDPITGSAATGRRGVTVIAPSGMTADALATAVKVLGAARGLPVVDSTEGAAALVIEETPEGSRDVPVEALATLGAPSRRRFGRPLA